MKPISKERFDALAGYTRLPRIMMLVQEAAWFEIGAERLLGIIVWDRTDYDYGWVVLGRDARGRFRAITQNVSRPSFDDARDELAMAMEEHAALDETSYHQGDEVGAAVDFFRPRVKPERQNRIFSTLLKEARYSPAKELIAAMMPFYEDVDGNFIEQFQSTGFDARLWELYLFAAFVEIGYAKANDEPVPDLVLEGPLGRLAIEATTVNPPQGGDVPRPESKEEFRAYLEEYVPIKLSRALTRKLYHPKRYWLTPGLEETPFIVAVQDFHAPGAMRWIQTIATEYVYGIRHSIEKGVRKIERIAEHRFGQASVESGFFNLPEAENVSAVMLNPSGTLTKFNRLGFVAGFGDQRVRMVRTGLARGELGPGDPLPKPFRQNVSAPDYSESWIEGAIILHNPNAKIPLDPGLIPGASHEFAEPDGRLYSLLPEFQPWLSGTSIVLDDGQGADADIPDTAEEL